MKRKKLYYVPGLVSILGLPILLFFLGPPDPDRHTAMTLRLPSDEDHSPNVFNRDGWFTFIKNKKIETIDLDYASFEGFDEREDVVSAHRFHFVTEEIEKLVFTHDTATVLKVELGENNSYGDFVWLFNHMAFYRIRHCAFIDNSLYILSNNPSEHYHTEPLFVDEIYLKNLPPPPTWWESFKHRIRWKIRDTSWVISIYLKHNRLLIPGFLLLILIPSFGRIRRGWVIQSRV
jgi:hypothetical protein